MRQEKDGTSSSRITRISRTAAVEAAIQGALDVQYSKRPALPDDFPAYVEPTLHGCAHLVVEDGPDFGDTSTNRALHGGGRIYLGSQKAAEPPAWKDLVAANIQGIINCTKRVPNHFQNNTNNDNSSENNNELYIRYCNVAVNDEAHADILSYLEGATTFLHHLIQHNMNVLVHCERGISRSATVVLAFLIRFHKMTRDKAYLHVKARRPSISPNPGFWDQLEVFEQQCRRQEEQRGESNDESNTTNMPVNEVIDTQWAHKSNALFATCRWMPELLKKSRYTQCLLVEKANTNDQYREHVLCVCLDYIWGRGVLDIDVEWLSFICQSLDEDITPAKGGRQISAAATVHEILQNEESEFWSVWGGEIYPTQIQKVLLKLNIII